jgi:MSHA pilin protein MshD
MYTELHRNFKKTQSGISLVELIMFIVIVSLGIVGILSVMNVTTKASADPMLRKQAVAIAESLLEEIELQAFTFCDPDDANALTATAAVIGAGGCFSTVQGLGAAGETRYADPRFDNVGDYHGFNMVGIRDIQNTLVNGLGGFTANVTMVQDGATFGVAAAEVLRIDVRVTSGPTDITLSGYRFRYSPRTVP